MYIKFHVKEIAEQKDISRTKLSRRAEINYATINALWNNESKDAMTQTLAKIARVLNCKISELYTVMDDEI